MDMITIVISICIHLSCQYSYTSCQCFFIVYTHIITHNNYYGLIMFNSLSCKLNQNTEFTLSELNTEWAGSCYQITEVHSTYVWSMITLIIISVPGLW